MLSHRNRLYIAIGFSVLAFSGISEPARAGFEWVPSAESQPQAVPAVPVERNLLDMPAGEGTHSPQHAPVPAPSASPMSDLVPAPTMKTRVLTPSPVNSANNASQDMGAQGFEAREIQIMNAPPAQVGQDGVKPLNDSDRNLRTEIVPQPLPAPVAPPPLMANPAPAPVNYEVVEGFGEDMPLALALRQVVPPRYAFSFHPGVNPGARVSWNGGRPWINVVSDMIAPLNMEAQVKDNILVLQLRNGNTVQQMPAIETQAGAARETAVSAPMAGHAPAGSSVPVSRRNMITDPGAGQTAQPAVQPQANNATPAAVQKPAAQTPAQTASNYGAPVGMQVWQAQQGASLKETLGLWSRQANMGLVWNAPQDYTLNTNFMISGSFDTAVKALLAKAVPNAPQYNLDTLHTKNLTIQGRTAG